MRTSMKETKLTISKYLHYSAPCGSLENTTCTKKYIFPKKAALVKHVCLHTCGYVFFSVPLHYFIDYFIDSLTTSLT